MQSALQVVKANQVIEASYSLSVVEQRIILSAISRIPAMQEVTDQMLYYVTASDLEKLGVHEKTAYRDLKEGVNRLYERSIYIDDGVEQRKMRWVQEIGFVEGTRTIGIRFSTPILPFLSNLSREFTRYALADIAGMQSAYAIRIYELLIQYRSIGYREVSVEDLRKMLVLGGRYPAFADLKRWVIDVAVTQINEHSPFQVNWTPRKTGRKVTTLAFEFIPKEELKSHKTRAKRSTPKIISEAELSQLARPGETREVALKRLGAMVV